MDVGVDVGLDEKKLTIGRDVQIGERYGNIATDCRYQNDIKLFMYDTKKLEVYDKRYTCFEKPETHSIDIFIAKYEAGHCFWKDGGEDV